MVEVDSSTQRRKSNLQLLQLITTLLQVVEAKVHWTQILLQITYSIMKVILDHPIIPTLLRDFSSNLEYIILQKIFNWVVIISGTSMTTIIATACTQNISKKRVALQDV